MDKIQKKAKEVITRDNYSEYCRVRDIVNDVYMHYMMIQGEAYGHSNIDGFMLADEAMLLILDILQNHQGLSNKEIADITIREADIAREWHR